jgi:hypothetical protein
MALLKISDEERNRISEQHKKLEKQVQQNKDELKIKRKFEKLIPVISKLEVTSEEMYNGLNSRWGR